MWKPRPALPEAAFWSYFLKFIYTNFPSPIAHASTAILFILLLSSSLFLSLSFLSLLSFSHIEKNTIIEKLRFKRIICFINVTYLGEVSSFDRWQGLEEVGKFRLQRVHRTASTSVAGLRLSSRIFSTHFLFC